MVKIADRFTAELIVLESAVFRFSRLGLLAFVFCTAGCSSLALNSNQRVVGQALPACPSKPNCVNSEVQEGYPQESFIAPFAIEGDSQAKAWQTAREHVRNSKRTTIVFEQEDYLHAEVSSPWGIYTDDLALRLDSKNRVIHVRSSSRVGYYDFGVNRDRVEALRQLINP